LNAINLKLGWCIFRNLKDLLAQQGLSLDSIVHQRFFLKDMKDLPGLERAILTFMPIGMAAAMFFLNPTYMMRLFDPTIWFCVPFVVIMVFFGNILVRRMAKIDV
jgi:hypothetical protein